MNSSSSTREKGLFMYVCLINKLSSSPTLGLIIKQTNLKHNNVFVNNLVIMRTQINYRQYYIFICIVIQKYIYIDLKLSCISL